MLLSLDSARQLASMLPNVIHQDLSCYLLSVPTSRLSFALVHQDLSRYVAGSWQSYRSNTALGKLRYGSCMTGEM